MAVRTRVDVWSISVGTQAAARTQPWHPVLDTYARGVGAMAALDPQVPPDSWRYVANTHGIDAQTPPRPGIWRQCAHARRLFLPWHRAYLAWLEEIIRRLTGDTGWAIPYWDYTKPSPARVRDVPPEFRVPTRRVNGQTVTNPLFVNRATTVPAFDVEVVPALAQARFVRHNPNGGFVPPGFGGADIDGSKGLLEQEPHDLVHVDLGALMGQPSTAGRDPIFWLHHANIDRLWEVWRNLPGSVQITADPNLPTSIRSEWTSASFTFGEGHRRRRYRMRDCENIATAPMEYRYDTLALPPVIAAAVASARAAAPAPGGPMGFDSTEDDFEPVGSTSTFTDGATLDIAFDQPVMGFDASAPRHLYLELTGVRSSNPHDVYVVEVGASLDAPRHRAGRFATFGLDEVDDDDAHAYVVDATTLIPALVEDGWTGGQLSVRVIPDSDRSDASDPERGVEVEQLTVYVSR